MEGIRGACVEAPVGGVIPIDPIEGRRVKGRPKRSVYRGPSPLESTPYTSVADPWGRSPRNTSPPAHYGNRGRSVSLCASSAADSYVESIFLPKEGGVSVRDVG